LSVVLCVALIDARLIAADSAKRSAFLLCSFLQVTRFDPSSLRVAELRDFNLGGPSFKFVANGCNGAVCFLTPAAYLPSRGVRFPENRVVAIKSLFNYRSNTAARLDTVVLQSRFDREYLVPLQFPHWTIVNVYNYFRSVCIPSLFYKNVEEFDASLFFENTTYFTMEACKAGLDSWCDARCKANSSSSSSNSNNNSSGTCFDAKSDIRLILVLMLQILLAVAHLDRHSVRHLDLKLDNIFVIECRGGVPDHQMPQVVLGDFGTTIQADTVNTIEYGAIEGNLANRAPEVIRPADVRAVDISKADVWAAGCVLYQLIENKHPFLDADQPDQLVLRVCYQPLPKVSASWRADSSGGASAREVAERKFLDKLLYGMLLVREPTQRYTAQQAINEIENFLWLPADCAVHDTDTWLDSEEQKLFDELQAAAAAATTTTTTSNTASDSAVPPMTIEQLLRMRFLVSRRYPTTAF
jgi:serine/threonine protein kinase